MKHLFDYYGILFFSLFIILLSLFFIFHFRSFKYFVDLLFSVKNKSEYNLFFFSIIFIYFSIIYILSFCKTFIYNKSLLFYQNYQEKPLFDTLQSIIPFHKYSIFGSEIILFLFILIISILFYLKRNLSLLSHFIILLALIQIFRSIIFSLTLLPDSSQNCTFGIFAGSCNDLLFSGHISAAFLILLYIHKYNLLPSYFYKILIFLFILMLVFIISSRNHYSIDILIAIITTYFIYSIYFNKFEKYLNNLF